MLSLQEGMGEHDVFFTVSDLWVYRYVVLVFGIISRSMCKCSSKKVFLFGLFDSKGSETAQLARAGNRPLLFLTFLGPPPLENISHLSVSSLWVCAWSWSPGMEAPSVGYRLLHIPFFHQQIRRVSLFLIDFSSPPPHPPFSLSFPLSLHNSCSFCLSPLLPSTDCKHLQLSNFVPVKQFPSPVELKKE